MRTHLEANERVKRSYATYLRQAKGQDETSIDKALAALAKFEASTRCKPFKKFHREQAGKFKEYLAKAKNPRTGKPLSHATIDATLRLVKAFFHWLAGEPGFKSVVSYGDSTYFNNNAKDARVAHTGRDIPHPTMEQAAHAFQAMPNATDFERRDKALFAFFMLTCARDGAVASLKLKHVNIDEGHVLQDARDVRTKNSKTIDTWFYPVGDAYLDCFCDWYAFLRAERLFGPEDALFPKTKIGKSASGGGFANLGLDRAGYATGAPLNEIVKSAFAAVQLPEFPAHSFRKTIALYGDSICPNLESFKAWSMNMGHENLATTVSAYMPVNRQRQRDLIRGIGACSFASPSPGA